MPNYIALVTGEPADRPCHRVPGSPPRRTRTNTGEPMAIELTAADPAAAWVALRGTPAVEEVRDQNDVVTTPAVAAVPGLICTDLAAHGDRTLSRVQIRLFQVTEIDFVPFKTVRDAARAAVETAKLNALAGSLGYDVTPS